MIAFSSVSVLLLLFLLFSERILDNRQISGQIDELVPLGGQSDNQSAGIRGAAAVHAARDTCTDGQPLKQSCHPDTVFRFGIVSALQRGQELFSKVEDEFILKEADVVKASYPNPNLRFPTPKPERREYFWELYRKHDFDTVMKIYNRKLFVSRIKKNINRIKGMIKK
jgi:hypothetical protein